MIPLPNYEAMTTRGRPFNAPLVGAERWLQDHLDIEMADKLIQLIKEKGNFAGCTYITNLGFKLKESL